jgi:cyclic pyranopterin phosphate synthase
MISIYTDGSCQRNPGRGGWAAIIVDDGNKRVLSGGEKRTTNNRMELMAAIQGLEAAPKGSTVVLYTDSQYLVNTMTRGWQRKVNNDLWDRLDSLVADHEVQWEWVRGHNGNPGNEEANTVAGREAGVLAPKVDSPTEGGAPEPVSQEAGGLTHVDAKGRAQMVDVGPKAVTQRLAVARGFVSILPEVLNLIAAGKVEKGDVFAAARIAGIMGAKQTSSLIPLCHPLPLDQVTVEVEPDLEQGGVSITATARTSAKTGVEMEALTAVSVAALTIYDMCKALDRGIRIQSIQLVRKQGGKSGDILLED